MPWLLDFSNHGVSFLQVTIRNVSRRVCGHEAMLGTAETQAVHLGNRLDGVKQGIGFQTKQYKPFVNL